MTSQCNTSQRVIKIVTGDGGVCNDDYNEIGINDNNDGNGGGG